MTSPVSIALLEDSRTDSALITRILASAGYHCEAFSDSNELLAALRYREKQQNHEKFSLLLLDWELPGINGMEVLQWMQANLHEPPPTIFVTNRTLESDIVSGLNAGANDYLTKPVRAAELIARIQVQLRRGQTSAEPGPGFTLGAFTVDMAQREIQLRGLPIALTPKEFDLAALFLRHPWRLFSREDLSTLIWNRELPSTSRTLDTHLSNIRKKLQFGPSTHTLLSASYALGYRLELLDAA